MSGIPAYERDPYRTELDAEVLIAGEENGRPFAVLSDTIFFPEGGGQPSDRGLLAGIPLLDVQRRESVIRHYLEHPVPRGSAALRLDWPRRFDHMQQHTGQHLLTAVAADRFGFQTTAFHLGERVSDIELAAGNLAPERLRTLEEAVAAEIRAAHPVSPRRVSPEEYARLSVRTRGLPEGHEGEIRLVEIEGLDRNTCGGTHLRSTAEIELIALLGTEPIRGGTRLFFAAGGRARRRIAEHEERSALLRKILGAPDGGLVAAVEEQLGKLKEAERTLRGQEEEEARLRAAELANGPVRVASATFAGKGGAFLNLLSKNFQPAARDKVALLTASDASGDCFLLVAGADSRLDVQAAGREVAAILGGKGGGSGRVFQGKAGSLGALPAALERLRALAL
ncbi:MAG: alanyl-tRNA editing protein [Thermoanaerobaculia bacterium]